MIIGVARDCTEADIKKAYRKESLIHHPDKGGDEEKFKLVVEAHSVLSDPNRRHRYDMGEDEDGMDASGMRGDGMGAGHADLSDLFAQFGGGMPPGFGQYGGMGGGGSSFYTHSFRGGMPNKYPS
jgi:DnaJ homolog subfamily C member 7